MKVTVGEDPQRVREEEKHLPTTRLLERLKGLRKSVARQKRFADPEAAYKKLRLYWLRRRNELDEHDGAIEKALQELDKYSVQKPMVVDRILETSRSRETELRAVLAGLRVELAEKQVEIPANGLDQAEYERLVKLQSESRTLKAQIEERKRELDGVVQEIAEAEAQKKDYTERAARAQSRVKDLELLRPALKAEADAAEDALDGARDQKDLQDILLRIHRRLSQAASVFVFALLGIPVGILAGRRSVMSAFGISFAVVLVVFYPLLILGQIAAEVRALPMVPAVWGGDALTGAIGLILMARVMRR